MLIFPQKHGRVGEGMISDLDPRRVANDKPPRRRHRKGSGSLIAWHLQLVHRTWRVLYPGQNGCRNGPCASA